MIGACHDQERSGASAPSIDDVAATSIAAVDDCRDVGVLSETDRLSAMLVVQTLVLTWELDVAHVGMLLPPADAEVTRALDRLRCDAGARAVSRQSRAIAKLLGHDWTLARATPYLLRLGFTDAAAIGAFKTQVSSKLPDSIFALHAHDPEWLEYLILRHLTMVQGPPGRTASLTPGWTFGPSAAYAQMQPPSCWQPESPSTYKYVIPYVKVTAYVSVDIAQNIVQANVDPQQWNVCGRFWSPPDTSGTGTIDGARFVKQQWAPTDPCFIPQEPMADASPATQPGDEYPTHYLFEYFFLPGPVSLDKPLDAWFKNILGIEAYPVPHRLPSGATTPAHHIDYWLGLCGTGDNVDGAMGGAVYGNPLKTILDSGDIEVWTEDSRTHVAVTKKFELSDPTANWLTQLNPALRELNEQLGELACCL